MWEPCTFLTLNISIELARYTVHLNLLLSNYQRVEEMKYIYWIILFTVVSSLKVSNNYN